MSLKSWLRQRLIFNRIVGVLFLGNLVSAVGRFMMRPFMTLYVYERFHVPLAQLGWFISFASLAGVLAGMVAGTLADQVGRRPVMIGSLAVSAALIAGYTQTRSLAVFTALFILHGAISQLFFPASSATIADVTRGEERIHAYGLVRIAVNVGAVFGPMLAGLILSRGNYNTAFLFTALSNLAFTVMVILWVPETRPERPGRPGARAGGSYREVLSDSLLMLFVLVGILVGTSYAQLETTLPLYLTKQLALPMRTYTTLLALNGALVVVFQAPLTWLIAPWRTGRTLALSSALYALGFASYAFLRTQPPLLVMMVVITLAEMLASPSYSRFVADLAPPHLRGRYMAVSGLSWAAAGVIGPALGGTVMAGLGGASVWVVASALCALAVPLYLYLEQAHARSRAAMAGNSIG
ncbi:MAG: MDR family MFS transporter [Betaproteobacteria bacterium]